MTVTIFHNPKCGTSRAVLSEIRASGVEPAVVEYLKDPPTRGRLVGLVAAMGVPVRAVIRENEPCYAQLGLGDPTLPDDALIDAILAHPVLMNRPIVETPKGTRLCRPAERVLDLLDARAPDLSEEDGKTIG